MIAVKKPAKKYCWITLHFADKTVKKYEGYKGKRGLSKLIKNQWLKLEDITEYYSGIATKAN